MFLKRIIRLSETDATGVLFFANLFLFASEALEELLCLHQKDFPSKNFGKEVRFGPLLLPVISAKANYVFPLRLSDEVHIELFVKAIKCRSFELHSIFTNASQQKLCGKVEIIHVSVEKESFQPIPLPQHLKEILLQYKQQENITHKEEKKEPSY